MRLRTRFFIIAMAVSMSLAGFSAMAADNVQVTLDGTDITPGEPILMWDMIFPLLPAQSYLQALGATVGWDAAAEQLDAELPGIHLVMWAGRNWATVNGQRENMEYGLETISGVPYVPGPATARLLGFNADFSADTLVLAITSPAAPEVEMQLAATLLAPPGEGVPVVLTVREQESGRVRDVPLDQRATIARGRTGDPTTPATVDDLQPGDLLDLGLTRQGVAATVSASYGQQLGTIASIQGNQLQLQEGGVFPLGEGVSAVGSDGTPLHVLGTAGEAAILRLNPATNAVWGIFSQRRGNPVPPDAAEPVIAGFFVPGYDTPLTAGETLQLVMLGSAGGTATVLLPGQATALTLAEIAPGVYAADLEIPDGMEIASTRLTGRLANAAGQSASVQSTVEVMVDTLPPRVYNMTPPPDGVVEAVQPRISASFQDRGPSGIDPSSVSVTLDGRDASPRAEVTATGFVRTPERLTPGRHSFGVEVSDFAGNTAMESWEFMVAATGPQIVGVTHDAAGPLRPGDTIAVSATVAATGQRANFDIAGVVNGVAMQLEPGTTTYTGTYTVREADRVDNGQVTVHFTDAGGTVHDATADTPVSIVAPEPEVEAPAAAAFSITAPEQGQQTGRNITPAGTGPAGERVQWVITYQKLILGGEVARGTATVADDGTWQADAPVDLKLLLVGMADRYTLTAQLLGEGDAVVDEASVNFTARE